MKRPKPKPKPRPRPKPYRAAAAMVLGAAVLSACSVFDSVRQSVESVQQTVAVVRDIAEQAKAAASGSLEDQAAITAVGLWLLNTVRNWTRRKDLREVASAE